MIYIRAFLPAILSLIAFLMMLRSGFRKNGMIAGIFSAMPAYMLIQNKYNMLSAINAMALVFVLVYTAALAASAYQKTQGWR